MSKAGVSFDDVKNVLMSDEEFKEEYEKLQPCYKAISQIIEEKKRSRNDNSNKPSSV